MKFNTITLINKWDNSYGNVWKNDKMFIKKWIENHKRDIESSISKMIKLSRYKANNNAKIRERIFDESKISPNSNKSVSISNIMKSPLKKTTKLKSILF